MATRCSMFKEGQVWICENCGIELKVVKACASCDCKGDFMCCGEPLKLKG